MLFEAPPPMLTRVLLPGCPSLPTLNSWLLKMCSYRGVPVRDAEPQAPPQTYEIRLCISIPPPYQAIGIKSERHLSCEFLIL